MININSINPPADIDRIDSVFALLAVIADPAAAKAAATDLKKLLKQIQEQRSAVVKEAAELAKTQEGAKVLATSREADLLKREKKLADLDMMATNQERRQGELDKLAAKLTAANDALKQETTRVDVAASALKQREDAAAQRETKLKQREEAVAKDEQDLAARMNKLKAIVG